VILVRDKGNPFKGCIFGLKCYSWKICNNLDFYPIMWLSWVFLYEQYTNGNYNWSSAIHFPNNEHLAPKAYLICREGKQIPYKRFVALARVELWGFQKAKEGIKFSEKWMGNFSMHCCCIILFKLVGSLCLFNTIQLYLWWHFVKNND
jgi:hypothetical protein